jgi:hypothetical protein
VLQNSPPEHIPGFKCRATPAVTNPSGTGTWVERADVEVVGPAYDSQEPDCLCNQDAAQRRGRPGSGSPCPRQRHVKSMKAIITNCNPSRTRQFPEWRVEGHAIRGSLLADSGP